MSSGVGYGGSTTNDRDRERERDRDRGMNSTTNHRDRGTDRDRDRGMSSGNLNGRDDRSTTGMGYGGRDDRSGVNSGYDGRNGIGGRDISSVGSPGYGQDVLGAGGRDYRGGSPTAMSQGALYGELSPEQKAKEELAATLQAARDRNPNGASNRRVSPDRNSPTRGTNQNSPNRVLEE